MSGKELMFNPEITSQATLFNGCLSGEKRATITQVSKDNYQLKTYYWFNPVDWYRDWKYGDIRSQVIGNTMTRLSDQFAKVDPTVRQQFVKLVYVISGANENADYKDGEMIFPDPVAEKIIETVAVVIGSCGPQYAALVATAVSSLSDSEMFSLLGRAEDAPKSEHRLYRTSRVIPRGAAKRTIDLLLSKTPEATRFIETHPNAARDTLLRSLPFVRPVGKLLGGTMRFTEMKKEQWKPLKDLINELWEEGTPEWRRQVAGEINRLAIFCINEEHVAVAREVLEMAMPIFWNALADEAGQDKRPFCAELSKFMSYINMGYLEWFNDPSKGSTQFEELAAVYVRALTCVGLETLPEVTKTKVLEGMRGMQDYFAKMGKEISEQNMAIKQMVDGCIHRILNPFEPSPDGDGPFGPDGIYIQ